LGKRSRKRSEWCPERRLIVHGVELEAWCRRWDIGTFDCPCGGCGKPLAFQPFAAGTLRGIVAIACACGYYEPCICGRDDHPHFGLPFGVVRDPRYGDLFDVPK
jgi:hypothetical protein